VVSCEVGVSFVYLVVREDGVSGRTCVQNWTGRKGIFWDTNYARCTVPININSDGMCFRLSLNIIR
jgi:hypothetical protein